MSEALSVFWFRNDLRTTDNPGLCSATGHGTVIPIYIWDTETPKYDEMGAASKWWLHHSLKSLMDSGIPLKFFKGKPLEILKSIQHKTGCQHIHWNRNYQSYTIKRDQAVKQALSECHSHNGSLLYEPWTIKNGAGEFYKVFTPYWRAARAYADPRPVLTMPNITYFKGNIDGSCRLEDLNLLPKNKVWPKKLAQEWRPGEASAHKALSVFLEDGLMSYKTDRDIPGIQGTSRLSPHLHFGEISPHQIWDAVHEKSDQRSEDVKTYLSELGWREFSYYLLFHVENLTTKPFQKKFEEFIWEDNDKQYDAWTKGQTGYPIVDAGMRELWQTGYVHNRVRMIVASFLTKHCLVHWIKGERWFWDCLVDADPASNAASWQWVAGCGADAAPFFRIFNPVTQSEKFDPKGEYIRKYVPELSGFSDKDIHKPYETSLQIQQKANCIIGQDYPNPIVDLQEGRERALARFKGLSQSSH